MSSSPDPSPTAQWNLADLLETIADVRQDAPMIVEGGRARSWTEVDREAGALAAHWVAAGLTRGDRVGVCLRNSTALLVSYIAACKAALVPFNINFRYSESEIAYLLDNADARAVVTGREFGATVGAAIGALGAAVDVVEVADGLGDEPGATGARSYADVVARATTDRFTAPWARSADDLLFLYTGGTTGMPKAVMWRQGDLVELLAGSDAPPGDDRSGAGADIARRLAPRPRRSSTAAPMVHGTGLLSQLANFMTGGASVIIPGRRLDPDVVWSTVADGEVEVLVIVGDPFARPLLDQLDAHPDRYDLSRLRMITSSGAMFSRPVKAGLLAHVPHAVVLDAYGSSEASGLGASTSTVDELDGTAEFRAGVRARVLADDGTWLEPGCGRPGRIAMRGPIPLGYHKDPVKSAETYPVIDGVRYSIPGDYVLVAADGRMTLLGRGSAVINTGGEKVYPEEIEERLKEHPAVVDAGCVGVPDDRFGEVVSAVVQLRDGAATTADELRAHVRAQLAPYKVPRHVVVVDAIERHPNGKLDRRAITDIATAALTA